MTFDRTNKYAWFNYACALQQIRKYLEALRCYEEVLKLDSQFAPAYNDMAAAHIALKQFEQAERSAKLAISIKPDYAEAHNNLGVVYKNQNRLDEAIECYQEALRCKGDYAMAMFNLGAIHFIRKDFDQASLMFRNFLEFDPDQIEAHQNLAAILLRQGKPSEAQKHLDYAYKKQPIFIDELEHANATVLILWSSGNGNVPIDHLWPDHYYRRICCMMEYVSDEQMSDLPKYDIVFNAIGDSDATVTTDPTVNRFRERCKKPFLNSPLNIAKTARNHIPALLSGIDHLVCAHTLCCETESFKQTVLNTSELQFPIIIRPAGSHGGEHLLKVESATDLHTVDLFNSQVYYASNYVDSRSADGYFRKYRVIFINRQAFPYHLAISQNWIVHYQTADMQGNQWKLNEERAFLEDPCAVLGDNAMKAINQIGRILDLDYCGVDFSLLPDGRVLVFEANATMLIHGEACEGVLQHKNHYVRKIFSAFNQHVENLMCGFNDHPK